MIEKGLYQLPKGMPQAAPPPEIDIGNPNIQENDDGSVMVDLSGEPDKPAPITAKHDEELTQYLEEDFLAKLGSDLATDIEEDLRSRADWEKTYKNGLRLLGLKIEDRNEPWPGACGVVHPILTESVIRFQAELTTETFPAAGPVKTKIWGAADKKKEEAAERVRQDMNIQLTDVMTEYRSEHERLLFALPAIGCAFKKVYYDPSLGRQTSMFVDAEDFIMSYGTSDLASCPRYAQRMKKTPNELKKMMASGFYRDIELADPVVSTTEIKEEKDKINGQTSVSKADHHNLYEANVDLDLPGFEDPLEIDLPYIVTIDKDSQKVLSIRRNWEEKDPQRKKQQYFVRYNYIPGFGAYGLGLIHIVGGFADSATSILRQLVDAGTLSNLPGGFKTRGLRIKGDDNPIEPGEWRDVDVPSGVLKENVMPLPYKEPSAVLAALLQTIVDEGRSLAAVAEMKMQDFDSNSPVGTTMALLERTLKVMSSVQARIYESMKLEFRLIKDIITARGAAEYDYDPETGDRSMRLQDYALVDVMPVADPNAATMSQRIVQWQAVMQLAAMAPQIYDLPELHGQMLDILGVKNVAKLIPGRKSEMQPSDPVSENMAILNMQPVKAFIAQDHMSHIAVHQAAMQDPKVQAMVGQNPMAQQIQAAAMAHLMEHVGYAYRNQIEQQLGMPMPPPNQPMPPEVETRLSGMMAQAAQKLLANNQNEVAQQAAQRAAQDPVLQQQMADTKVKADEVRRKAKRDDSDVKLKAAELMLREKESTLNTQAKGVELGMKNINNQQDRAAKEKTSMLDSAHNIIAAVLDAHGAQQDHLHQAYQAQQVRAHEAGMAAIDRTHKEKVALISAKAKATVKPTTKK